MIHSEVAGFSLAGSEEDRTNDSSGKQVQGKVKKKWIGLLLSSCVLASCHTAHMAGLEQEEERREQLKHMIDAIDQEENLKKPIIKEEGDLAESPVGGGTEPPEGDTAKAASFRLRGIDFRSDIGVDTDVLREAAKKYIGTKVTLADLKKIGMELTHKCREEGWLGAICYLPEQTSEDGRITFGIASGTFGEIHVKNESKLSTPILESILRNKMPQGAMVEARAIENALYRINALGGIRATARLEKATPDRRGQVDIYIDAKDSQRQRLITYLENYGTESAGRYRLGLMFDKYNFDGRGSNLQLATVNSNKQLRNFAFDISMISDRPSASRLGLNVAKTRYHLTKEFDSWDASGDSMDITLYGSTPLYKTLDTGYDLEYGYRYRNPVSDFKAFGINSERTTHSVYGKITGYQRFPNGVLSYSLKQTWGTTHNDTPHAEILNAYGHGAFGKTEATVELKHLWNRYLEFHTKLNAQFASKGLDSSEKLYLGGASGVRAYADGDANGDRGYLMQTELIYNTKCPGLAFSLFYDVGEAGNKRGDSSMQLIRGWGVGVRFARPNDFFLKIDYARKIGFNREVTSDTGKGRVWFLAGKIF